MTKNIDPSVEDVPEKEPNERPPEEIEEAGSPIEQEDLPEDEVEEEEIEEEVIEEEPSEESEAENEAEVEEVEEVEEMEEAPVPEEKEEIAPKKKVKPKAEPIAATIVAKQPVIVSEGAISPQSVPVTVVVELARLEMNAKKLFELGPGNVIDLEKSSQDVWLSVNGKVIGKGQLMKIGDVIGVRVLEIGTSTQSR